MRTRALGNSGLVASCIGLGAMPLSLSGRPSEDAAVGVIHTALDAGMTLIDTADVYCIDERDIGHNERLIARALREWGGGADPVVVATKGGLERPGGAWVPNGNPVHLTHACEASLRALGVEAIDLYQLHAPDPKVPFEDSVGALRDLHAAGKIRHVGLSNVRVDEIRRAQEIVDVVSVQNRCNVFDRNSFDNGVIDFCAEARIAFLPYSPVGGYRDHARIGDHPVLRRIAEQHGATPYEVALAWLLTMSTAMIPIPGASRTASVASSAKAAEIELNEDETAAITESSGDRG